MIIGVLIVAACIVPGVTAGAATTGNGAPSGAHFTLNLIGSEKVKDSMPANLGGNTIFVKLANSGMVQTKILLGEGDFKVLDKDGTDGTAGFQLPYPLTATGDACYEVYARALGKPGGSANMYACTFDDATQEEYCYTGEMVTIQRPTDKNGVGKFQSVTKQLTTTDLGPIFSDSADSYYWYYDNTGLKHAQLRFYQTDTCA